MKYSITINPSSKNSKAMEHAFNFVQAVLQQKHHSIHVFFYGYAVKSIFFNNNWVKFDSRVTLVACSTIAEEYLTRQLEPCKNITIAGLAQWMEATINADKIMDFV